MITINLTRIKKAFLRPKAAFLYLKGYLEGEFLRFLSKKRVDLKKELPAPVYKNLEKHFIRRKEPKFFGEALRPASPKLQRGEQAQGIDFLEELSNQDFIINNADRICNNEFVFLGTSSKILKKINWNQDIKSGHLWPNSFYLDLREELAKDYNKGWDIKMVWELSRFQYVVPLALAFYKTGEEEYFKKWQELILNWIEKNPVHFGPNWINAMEVAIRACNWILSFEIIKQKLQVTPVSPSEAGRAGYRLQDTFLEKFLSSLIEHGKFIYRNLEYAPVRSNHYLSDIVGLVYLGIMFPEFKKSKKWLEKGLRGLEEEMKYQVYEDGVDYELSISYHRYVAELFLWTGWLYRINQKSNIPAPEQVRYGAGKNQILNYSLSSEFWGKIKKMVKFTYYYTKPNNLVPQLGDSDDGRLHIVWEDFYNLEKRNHFALFNLYSHATGKTSENTEKPSQSFSEAGFYIMRDKDFYLITGRNKCCYGKGGSHIHNDILSFELSMFGDDFIIDPGAYVYTPDFKARNKFRRTRAHNTIIIDNQEQNFISKEDPFYIEQIAQLTINQWETTDEKIILEAEHNGYEKLKCPIIHNRIFSFDREAKVLNIQDKFKGRGDHELEWNFHLSPQIKIWVKEDKAEQKEIILIGSNGSLMLSAPKILNCVIIEDEVSPSYGVKIPAKTIRFSGFFKQGFPKEYAFTFSPIK